FNLGKASDHCRLPEFGSNGFLQSYYNKSSEALDLCMKLNKMGISCDMSIWTKPEEQFRVDPGGFGSTTLHGSYGFEQNLSGASQIHDGYHNVSSVSQAFHQNNTFNGDHSFLGRQASFNPNGFEEIMAFHKPIKPSPCLRGVSQMFEGNRVSCRAEVYGKLGAFYTEDGQGSLGNNPFRGNNVSQTLTAAAKEGSRAFYTEELTQLRPFHEMRKYLKEEEPKIKSDLPLCLDSIVNIYGSVKLMAKDQIGCRVLQKLVEEGTFLDSKIIIHQIINHFIELSTDPFGNYFVQKLLEVSDEEHRTLIVTVLTSEPKELIQICLNTYGTRVVQKMIETVKTKEQIALVKSGLKPGFQVLVKDLNGNHVLQSCLESFGPNDNKFVLEAATKHCAEIAVHRHGCCVLQCCLSNSTGLLRERLVAEISRNSLHLSQDPFGNYVVQYLIDQQVPSVKLLVQFRTHYAELATQKFSSHVIEKCLRTYPESRGEIVRELLSVPNFEYLLQDPYANYVIQTALSVTKRAVRARLVEKVSRFGKLWSSPYCKKIFSKTNLKK
ncbi:hypothetical protein CARUB_v10011306mg, partial [Capsella rubella]